MPQVERETYCDPAPQVLNQGIVGATLLQQESEPRAAAAAKISKEPNRR